MITAMIPVIGGLVGKIIDRALPDKEAAAKAKIEMMSLIQTEGLKEMEAAQKVIVAEAKSDGVLARNWRPFIMMIFGLIIANNYLVSPILVACGVPAPVLDLPPDMWNLIQIGLGGYVVGRSAEKVARVMKK